MRTNIDGKHAQLVFDNLTELVDYAEHNPHMAEHMTRRMEPEFYGADSLSEVISIARAGLPADGIEAMQLSDTTVSDMELMSSQFQSVYDVTGSQVDVARYLSNEPECMINYYMEPTPRQDQIVTLVLGVGIPWDITTAAIKKHGQALMSVADAIERSGKQTEIWADLSMSSRKNEKTARISVRLKAPGDLFDAASFMYALTHPSMCRALMFNAFHALPEPWHEPVGVGSFYGYYGNPPSHEPDYPDGTVFIPAIRENNQAAALVAATLRQLGLVSD